MLFKLHLMLLSYMFRMLSRISFIGWRVLRNLWSISYFYVSISELLLRLKLFIM